MRLWNDHRAIFFSQAIHECPRMYLLHHGIYPDSTNRRIDIDKTSIRGENVGSIFNRCRSEGLLSGHSSMDRLVSEMGRHPSVSEHLLMMTSSNGNIFRVTGPLCGEFTGHRWIPLTKASDAELWYGWVKNRDAGDLRRHRAHYDVTVMWNTPTWLTWKCRLMRG